MTANDYVVLASLAAFLLVMLIRPTAADDSQDDGFWGWIGEYS